MRSICSCKTKVWELVPLLEGVAQIDSKWIFNPKRDSKGNVERYKVRLMEKCQGKETFSLVTSKNYFRTIMNLIAHYDFELHQRDVKTTFFDDNIDETIYIVQPENIVSKYTKNMVCKLTKFIYGLKQISRK